MAIELTDAAYEAALARGRESLSRPHAVEARYDASKHMLTIYFNTKLAVSFDPSSVEILKNLSASAFANAVVTPGGDGLIFDVEGGMAVSLPGLLAKVIPFEIAQNAMATKAGKSKSERKIQAARQNGALGGRPKRKIGGEPNI